MADITGSTGNDFLEGTNADDFIQGFSGIDNLSGLGGNDSIEGGTGTDLIEGGAGDDTLEGQLNNDIVMGASHFGKYIFLIDDKSKITVSSFLKTILTRMHLNLLSLFQHRGERKKGWERGKIG